MKERNIVQKIGTKQLPGWFDLSRYRATSGLSLSAWYDNLQWRYNLAALSDGRLEATREDLDSAFSKLDSLVIQDGLYGEGQIYPFESIYPDGSEYAGQHTATISSLRVSYVVDKIANANWGKEDLDILLAKTAKKWWDEFNSTTGEDDIEDEKTLQFLDQPIDAAVSDANKKTEPVHVPGLDDFLAESSVGAPTGHYSLHVEVDLGAPDKLVLADFRKWLKAARSAYTIESKTFFTDSMSEDWSDYKILPFMDLSLWARANCVEISDAVMGNALFPNEYDIDLPERIRKVVRPKAGWLMSPSIMNAIESQILHPEG